MDYLSWNFIALHLVFLGVYLCLALSLNLINGFTGMFSLGHQGFFAVGAYAAGAFVVLVPPLTGAVDNAGEGPPLGPAWFALSFAVAALAAALFGLVVGVPCLRLKGDYLAIATLGFGEIVRIVLQNVEAVGGPRGLYLPSLVIQKGRGTKAVLGVALSGTEWYNAFYVALTLALIGLTLLVIRNVLRSSHGRAIESIREDEVAAELLGVDLTRYKVTVFVIGAAFAGIAGALFAHYRGYITPNDFNFMVGITVLLYVVLGGMGSLEGTFVAGLILYTVEQVLKSVPDVGGVEVKTWWQVLFALLLIVIMLTRPQGIFGRREA